MNPTTSLPHSNPELEISAPAAEKWSAVLREERRRLHEDQESLREREHNLRSYEAKLRSLQDEIEAGRSVKAASLLGTKPPFSPRQNGRAGREEDPTLQVAWDKLHRARELLQAEQDHVRNDRNFLRELEVSLKHREEVLAAREARVAEREARLLVGTGGARPHGGDESHSSAVARITLAPFNMARSMLGGKK